MIAGVPPEVVKYFKVRATATNWILNCKAKGCLACWTFSKRSTLGAGSRLKLLDHARSHRAVRS